MYFINGDYLAHLNLHLRKGKMFRWVSVVVQSVVMYLSHDCVC